MSRHHRLVLSLCLVVLPQAAPAQTQGVAAVRWLEACWEMNAGSRRVVERWRPLERGEMQGSSRTVVGTREVESERLRIYAVGDTLIYDAQPSGQPRAEFRGRATEPDAVAFENPAHDFPQRISYRKVGTDSLVARIEGERNGVVRAVTYAYRRVPCGDT